MGIHTYLRALCRTWGIFVSGVHATCFKTDGKVFLASFPWFRTWSDPQSSKALLYKYYPTEQTESMSQNPEAKQKLHPIRPPPSLSYMFGPSPSVSRTVLLDRCRPLSLCIRLVFQSSKILARYLCASSRSLYRASSSSSERICTACVDCMSSCF